MSFKQFQFMAQINSNISTCGYEHPTPIQEKAIPEVMSGKDILGLAQTGTGKTAAFALPIIEKLAGGPRGNVRALIIAPTRELAEQITTSFKELAADTGLRILAVYGGVGKKPQFDAFNRGVEILVACPGRLLDHLNNHDLKLTSVATLVLDEADQMFDMGFFPDIRRILKHLPSKRQTLLFSATMPADIRKLADETLTNPKEIRIKLEQPLDLITQALYPVSKRQKSDLLVHILQKDPVEGSTLIFTRTKYGAKNLAKKLEKSGFSTSALQGNMSQNQRNMALEGFRDGTFKILVATDIAARGIDVSRVAQVVNFDLPSTAEAYTHRIGRTGRAERSGRAISFMCYDDQAMVKAIEKLQGKTIKRIAIDGFYMEEASEQQEQKGNQVPRKHNRRPKKQTGPRPSGNRQKKPAAKAKKSTDPKRASNIFGLGQKGK
ncbi:DNA/RNA helicase, superfamily II [Desulfocapsa sulfexigens DSM 10523]|uniref:DEAD-box ATP-dependent RNA helicase RhpA n=1 Tax=Desulfocapsa sulfexigens (strain DSM 10523 / SB164P1) TaxID=1167006 RepID=M1NA97_DESSD|nr:DEAD/DEAH box helicase [Desulfocapsa sulfexigens]AGF76779.1 DNA/RNA helicase, superfamily II [Desulfocapsa sulfexigens DSM 10523]